MGLLLLESRKRAQLLLTSGTWVVALAKYQGLLVNDSLDLPHHEQRGDSLIALALPPWQLGAGLGGGDRRRRGLRGFRWWVGPLACQLHLPGYYPGTRVLKTHPSRVTRSGWHATVYCRVALPLVMPLMGDRELILRARSFIISPRYEFLVAVHCKS